MLALIFTLLTARPARAMCDVTLARTHQLRDAWGPVLDEVSRRVRELSPDLIRKRFRRLRLRIHASEPTQEARRQFTRARDRGFNFDRMFIGQFGLGVHQDVGFSKDNRTTMRQLLRAVAVLDAYLTEWADDLDEIPSFAGARDFLNQFSFTGANAHHGLAIGSLTVLQAASWLTADAVDGFTPAQLLRATLTAPDRRVTPVAHLALSAPGNLLGRFASYMYTRHPLARDTDGRVRLSPALHAFLERAHELDPNPVGSAFDLGHGCPVAFRQPGAVTSGLQVYLDALVVVLDALEVIE